MTVAKSRMRFIIIISGLLFQVKFLSWLKRGLPRLFSELIDQLPHALPIACRLQLHLNKIKAQAR
jgi:hypothetical protein